MPFKQSASAADAREFLAAGNRRYAAGQPAPTADSAARAELASGQQPFAVIVGCSDSRVPVEAIFDQPPGSLFVIRLAGHVVTTEALASIEYGVSLLGAPLVVVLAHTSCGAVKAALDHVDRGTEFSGHLPALVNEIVPSVRALSTDVEDRWHAAIIEHARRSAFAIAESLGNCCVDAAIYNLTSGTVSPA